MDIVVIGDYPTALEVRKNTCMTGPAVKILKQTMQKVNLPIDTKHVYYTTAVKRTLPKKSNNVTASLIDECRETLLEEIKKIKPKYVIPLGKIAFQILTGNNKLKITAEYGRVHNFNYLPDITIIPIMHPALIMRAPNDFKPFLAALKFISQLYHGDKIYNPGETKWIVLKTDEDCDEAIKFLSNYKRITADIETTSLDYREAEFCVLGMCFEKNKVFVLPRELRNRIKDFFAIPGIKWTWHHGKYDRKVLWRRKLTSFNNLGWHVFPHQNDTMYMHYVLDETSAHDLGTLTKVYLQAKEYKYKMNQQFKAVTLETYPQYFDSLCERVAIDCDYGYQLEDVLWQELNKPENKSVLNLYNKLIMPATEFLANVEQNGMLIDQEFLHQVNKNYDSLLAEILHEIEIEAEPYWDPDLYIEEMQAKSAPEKFNPGSPKQMQWMVFNRLKLHPTKRKGKSTGKEVLQSINEDVPLIKKVLEYRRVKKEQSTYVIGLLKKCDIDGRVRSNFSLHVTATGRLSSKEPNVQNIPAANGVGNIRRAFIPPKGKIIMEVDYSGAELRWLAFLSGCPVLKEIFIEGRNLHKETATALFGPDFTAQQKMRAKAVNFGIPYGRQANSFKEEFNIPIEEAQQLIDNWLNKYYGAKKYLDWCANQVLIGNYLQTPWGNRRRFGLVTEMTKESLQNEAKNFPIQCSSSNTLLYSAICLAKELKEKYNTTICDLIHDSMYLEVPMDAQTVQTVSKLVSQFMINVPKKLFNCDVPFKTDTDLGPDWGMVCAYNNETQMMELEDEHHNVSKVPYAEWIQSVYHWDIYEKDWFKQLKPII